MINDKNQEIFPQDLVQSAKAAAEAVASSKPCPIVQAATGVDQERTVIAAGPTISIDSKTVAQKITETSAQREPLKLQDGQLMPTNFEEAWKVASMMAKSGMVPRQFNDNPAGIMAVLQTAKERGLNPMSALQNMANVNGRVTGFSELPLGEVYRAGIVEELREYWVDESGKEIDLLDFKAVYFAAVCEIKVKGRGLVRRAFTLNDAKDGGLLTNNTKTDAAWFKYRKRMMQMRARGWALKDAAPDVIAGLPMPEYDEPGEEPGQGSKPAADAPSGAKGRLLGHQSETTPGGQGSTVPGVQQEAVRSVPRSDVQGHPAGQPGEPHPAVSEAPHGAAPGLVQVPAQVSRRPSRARGARVDNRAAPLST